MAEWKCSSCGHIKDSRCKPRKYPNCGGSEFEKVEKQEEKKS